MVLRGVARSAIVLPRYILRDLVLSILGEHQGIARKHAQHVYWVDGPWWFGKLALAARPRGGDWLAEEVAVWKSAGVGAVLSLLTPEEERELDLVRMREEEKKKTEGLGLEFWSLPIEDRQVPDSDTKFGAALNLVDTRLSAGGNVLVHCRQGVGRTGLVAVCLLMKHGRNLSAAMDSAVWPFRKRSSSETGSSDTLLGVFQIG